MQPLKLTSAALLLWTLGLAGTALGEVANEDRARFHYQMFCQGCHTPDGAGANDVPPLKDMMGVFMGTQRGREFLVRVPGSATSALNNAHLAEVLNWCMDNFAGSSMPASGYIPFTAEEVGELRQRPLQEIVNHRASVLAEIATVTKSQ